VTVLQTWLRDWATLGEGDRRYDRPTQNAVRRFQRDRGLGSDGACGAATIKAHEGGARRAKGRGRNPELVFPIQPIKRVAPPTYWSVDQGIDIPPYTGFCGKQLTLVAVTDGKIVERASRASFAIPDPQGLQRPVRRALHLLRAFGARAREGRRVGEEGAADRPGRLRERRGLGHAAPGDRHQPQGGPTCCPGWARLRR